MSARSIQFQALPTDEKSIPRNNSKVSMHSNDFDEEAEVGSHLHHHPSFGKRSKNPLQARIYNFLERPSGIPCFLYHFTVFVIVIGCLVYSSILTVYVQQSYSILYWIEFILFILFLIEYIVRVWSSGCRSKYRGRKGRILFMKKTMCIVDLCVIIGYTCLLFMAARSTEFNIQLVRYVRSLQILRFLHVDRRLTSWRLLGSVVYDHRYELIATLYFSFIFLIVIAYLIWLVEKNEDKAPGEDMFHSFADTLWWSIITMTTIGYGDKSPQTYIGKMITSCLCICGVAFWTLPSGIIGSGFALKVEQKKREKQFNRLVPAAATLIQDWWRMCASRQPHLTATWHIYRIERKRDRKVSHVIDSNFLMDSNKRLFNTIRFRNGTSNSPSNHHPILHEKISWRRVESAEDLDTNQRTAIRIIRIIKFHVSRRKFRQAHKPYDFKDIMDENAQGNLKVMYTLADIQRRLDQTLGLPKAYPIALSDKDREKLTLSGKISRIESRLAGLERQTHRIIEILEDLCIKVDKPDVKRFVVDRIADITEEVEATS